MDYLLTEEQKMIKDLAHKIAEEKIRPQPPWQGSRSWCYTLCRERTTNVK